MSYILNILFIYFFFQLSSIPDNYDSTYLSLSRRGARVLALGYRKLPGPLSSQDLRELTREELEKNLIFAGFVIISCPLKPDSKAVIKEIVNASHSVNYIYIYINLNVYLNFFIVLLRVVIFIGCYDYW